MVIRVCRWLGALLLVWVETAVVGAAVERPKIVNRVQQATRVMQHVVAIKESGIPTGLLDHCEGLVIIPRMTKAAFFVGGNYGRGVLVHHSPDGRWSNPCFVQLRGGDIGFQAGGQFVDLVLVINRRQGLEAILHNKFTLGVDAGLAVGPLGRYAEAGTDFRLRSEVLAYCLSKGLFAGVSLKGSALSLDEDANRSFYRRLYERGQIISDYQFLFDRMLPYPDEVKPLLRLLRGYTQERILLVPATEFKFKPLID
ncbi:MAG TPA: lipid-binding SYLF domain-containing protein [Acidobacteriota bacterium]|jgi:lipid-binding SYLF domain-containing protein|nr:lipid-binding SYLF domain-containing protein [Acidobacteriota bacterium]HNT99363.1 lipid-binding SYLF domain-containing protein [Acidobacteriota bacterium]HPB29317.1 lipid-binding SYLF domain-containing protein [Acidobacteriota bacterium]HQP74216.1 lipid-binding SYLF domain-containing protein [Acidobacteriota bacterium]